MISTLPPAASTLATADSLVVGVLAAALIGAGMGGEADVTPYLLSRYFGLRHYSKIYSIMYALLAFGSGTAPTLFAAVYDRTLSYEVSFIAAAVLFAIGALIVVARGRYPVQTNPNPQESRA